MKFVFFNGPVTVSRPRLYAQTPPINEHRARVHLMKKIGPVTVSRPRLYARTPPIQNLGETEVAWEKMYFLGHALGGGLNRWRVTESVSLSTEDLSKIRQVFKVEFLWVLTTESAQIFFFWLRVCLLFISKAQFCQFPVYKLKNFRAHPQCF